MKLLKVVFADLGIILFLIIVVFIMKKMLNLSARISAEVKCGTFTFVLLLIKFLVNFKSFYSTKIVECGKETFHRIFLADLSLWEYQGVSSFNVMIFLTRGSMVINDILDTFAIDFYQLIN